MMFGVTKNTPRIFRKLPGGCSRFFPVAPRTVHVQKTLKSNYEGDGQTTMTVLNREYKELIMINSISDFGFRLNNGMFVVGPIAVFPRSVLQWNVGSFHDLNVETLSLFHLLEPKLDILIIGSGDRKQMVSKEVAQLFQSKKIALEILPTEHACSTFNFLNVERRCVAAAFIPPQHIFLSHEELDLIGTNPRLETMSLDLDHEPIRKIPEK